MVREIEQYRVPWRDIMLRNQQPTTSLRNRNKPDGGIMEK